MEPRQTTPLRLNDLVALGAVHDGRRVSIFMPTHRVADGSEHDRLRLKNLLRQAATELRGDGMRTPDVGRLLAPATELLDDRLFWRHQLDGLALFLQEGSAQRFLLPIAFDEIVVLGHRFHVKPLLPHFMADGHYFVLAASRNHVAVYRGTRHGLDELEAPDLPISLEDALRFDDPERDLQLHVASGGGPGAHTMFHGHGAGDEIDRDRTLRFLREVDRGLHPLLRDERAPLVLAGVEELLPIVREVTSYPALVDRAAAGNPEGLSPQQLHERTWPIVESRFLAAQRDALDRYRAAAGTGLASDELGQVLRAAEQGRVQELFVDVASQRWGRVDPSSGAVEFVNGEGHGPDDEELVDRAVVAALAGGATVHAPADGPPDGTPLAALLRY